MQPWLLDVVACRHCRSALRSEGGSLICSACDHSHPVVESVPVLDGSVAAPRIDRDAYRAFLRAKARRPVWDAYAAFHPFNESARALLPLVPLLRERLSPGDVIVDLWCRTGWSGELLAGLFPEQRVVSLCEGTDVLGYPGFLYWLTDRAPNLDLVFASHREPLPIGDGVAALVHGYDCLHHGETMGLAEEALRIAQPEARVVFPHVHLSDGDPDPFFERGETQRPGQFYRQWFAERDKRAFVLSERELWDGMPSLRDDDPPSHYNAAILVAESSCEGRPLREPAPEPDCRLVPNPLLAIDPSLGRASVALGGMAGRVDEILFRHPMVAERLERSMPTRLDPVDSEILYWGARAATLAEIAQRTERPVEEILSRTAHLQTAEIVSAHRTSPSMARLQHYFVTQRAHAAADEQTLVHLWRRAARCHAEASFLLAPADGSAFCYDDADTVVRMMAAFLRDAGVGPGERVVIEALLRPEVPLLIWAAIVIGAVAVPVSPTLADASLADLLARIDPAVTALAEGRQVPGTTLVLADEGDGDIPALAEAVGSFAPIDDLAEVGADDPAAILFTSGSSGVPKGVVLSHGGLFRSSATLDFALGADERDRYLGTGPFHTMSGLRNACMAPVHAGAALIVPPSAEPLELVRTAADLGATLLTTAPSFVTWCLRAGERARTYWRTTRPRAVLCTGAPLAPDTARRFREQWHVPVHDYYGLTETTGVCTFAGLDLAAPEQHGIGRPLDAVVHILDEAGQPLPPGETGELVVHTDNALLGYLDDPEATAKRVRRGWVVTGDRALRRPDGSVFLAGRRDRLIIDRHGENLHPEEVEAVLTGIAGVLQARVAAFADRHDDTRLGALVVAEGEGGDTEALRSGVRQELGARHVPDRVVWVSEIPRGPAGKPDDRRVRLLLEDVG